MKALLASAAALAMSTSVVFAQTATQQGEAQRQVPTCQEALPQIANLIGQADTAGLDTATAKSHLNEAREAKSSGQEQQCLESLVMAQNDVLQRAQAQGQQRSTN
ncbi:hypothetical protein [Amorphus coralli]|uniref:hypothetical protein n=1 Tax=Amorphus coralli TaxID=340680 RepID=UPI000377D10D|nr:hypothetical protein [Amorphus coralli]